VKGLLVVEDMSRSMVAGSTRLSPRYQPAQHGVLASLEIMVATELLRCTPKWWSGAMVWISREDSLPGGYDAHLLCIDSHPCHATASNRLWERIFRLTAFVENNSQPPYTDILLAVQWTAPRTWTWDSRYWRQGCQSPALSSAPDPSQEISR
jgi:hypothetical protein